MFQFTIMTETSGDISAIFPVSVLSLIKEYFLPLKPKLCRDPAIPESIKKVTVPQSKRTYRITVPGENAL